METRISSIHREVVIGAEKPTVLIGERINPTGRKKLAASLANGDLSIVRQEAAAQVEAGADIVDVNVGAPGIDEVEMLPRAVEMVMGAVEVPLSLDSDNPKALAAALKVYRGKPLINSVNGQEQSLKEVLPMVKDYGAAVVALTMDDDGIPKDSERRVAIAHKIVDRASAIGIPLEDIIIDSLVLTVATDTHAGLITLDTVRRMREELGVNQTMGASNISFGLPEREIVNNVFIAMAIFSGVTCPYVNAARVLPSVLAADLILGRDRFAQRYVRGYRQRLAAKAGT